MHGKPRITGDVVVSSDRLPASCRERMETVG